MPEITLTAAEAEFLIYALGPFEMVRLAGEHLPPGQKLELDGSTTGGGPGLRVRVLAFRDRLRGTEGAAPFGFSVIELWLVDNVLHAIHNHSGDLGLIKLRDGQSLLTFAEKIWHNLVAAYEDAYEPSNDRNREAAGRAPDGTGGADSSTGASDAGTDGAGAGNADRAKAVRDAEATIAAVEAAIEAARSALRSGGDSGTDSDLPAAEA